MFGEFSVTATHQDLVMIGDKWLKKRGVQVSMREIGAYTTNGEKPDIIGWTSNNTVLIECKTSRSDFFADRKKLFRHVPDKGMGDYRLYLCPEGILKPEDMPSGWGLLWWDGDKVKCISGVSKVYRVNLWSTDRSVHKFKKCLQSECDMLYSGCRRMVVKGHFKEIYKYE